MDQKELHATLKCLQRQAKLLGITNLYGEIEIGEMSVDITLEEEDVYYQAYDKEFKLIYKKNR